MINLIVNGKHLKLDKEISVSALLKKSDIKIEMIAVELNREIVPKKKYENTILKEGDVLEIISFVGGG